MSKWDELLPDSNFGVFHTPEGLRVLDEYASGDLHLFGVFNGQEPVGLMPLFIREKLNLRMVLSPPPGFGVRELGPVLFPVSPKSHKLEKLHKEFSETIINAVDADRITTIFRISGGPYYRDPRPFKWTGFKVNTAFTYQLELESETPEEVLESFSKSVRRDVRDGDASDITVRIDRRESTVRSIYETIETRYDDQQKSFPLSWDFMRDMIDSLGDRARVYVAESADGEFLSGIVVLYSNDTSYFWKGGAGRSDHGFSVNSLLHWRIIQDIIHDRTAYDIKRYDFHTANNERLVRYKSKFNGELVSHYRIESSGAAMVAAKKTYRKVVQ